MELFRRRTETVVISLVSDGPVCLSHQPEKLPESVWVTLLQVTRLRTDSPLSSSVRFRRPKRNVLLNSSLKAGRNRLRLGSVGPSLRGLATQGLRGPEELLGDFSRL